MKNDYTQIPLALLISLLKHVVHGQPLMLVNQQKSLNSAIQLQLCQDAITLAHLLRLRVLERELIVGTLIPELLDANNSVLICQYSVLHILSYQNAITSYQVQTDPEQASEANNSDFMLECESLADLNEHVIVWLSLFQKTEEMICDDIFMVLKYHKQVFMELKYLKDPILDQDQKVVAQSEVQREMIEVVKQEQDLASQILVQVIFTNWLNQESFSFLPIFDALCELRGFQSIFEYLDYEKKRLASQISSINIDAVPPCHEWSVDKLDKMMIKTDYPFVLSDIVWKLGLTYNHSKDQTLNANINIVVNPFQDKKSKMYFKKNEFFLPSNSQIMNKLGG